MEYTNLLETLGIGELPGLSEENNHLNHTLASKQVDISRLSANNREEQEVVGRVFGHWNGIKEALSLNQNINVAKRQEISSEKNFHKYHKTYHARNLRDGKVFEDGIDAYIDKNESLEEEINARATINELLEDEHMTDVEALLKWTEEVDNYEEDIFTLLKYQHADTNKVKELHLKLEKMRQLSSKAKEKLDEFSTENKMAQVALEKTAADFRNLHEERLATMEKWQESVSLVDKRNEELHEVFTKVGEIRAQASDANTELKEQTMFLESERGNVKELQRNIDAEDKKSQRLTEEQEKKEQELDYLDGEVILERRETWRVGGEIDSIRAKWKHVKDEYRHKLLKIETLRKELDGLKRKHAEGGDMALSAEERADQLTSLLHAEIKTHDNIQIELEKTREKKITAEKELHELQVEDDACEERLKGLRLEKTNITVKVKSKSSELNKKEETNLSMGYALSQLEREISRLKGGLTDTNRAELKANLDIAKSDLEIRLSDKRNLDHLVHKMMSDVKKVNISINQLTKQQEKVKLELEQIHLENDTCNREHKEVEQKVEALLLEEKMMKLNERKAKQALEELNQELLELQKQDLEVNEKLREQREELESKKELYIAQSRCIKDEIVTIKGETRDRKTRVDKLKIKFGIIVKALGETGKSDDEFHKTLPSHAFQLVKLAQEKAELRDQGEILCKRLEKEEKELVGLESTLTLLKGSNNSYRAINIRKAKHDEENDELEELKAKIQSKLKSIRQLKKQFDEQEDEFRETGELMTKCEKEIDLLQRNVQDRNFELQQLEKDMSEQERKYHRANNIRSNWEKQLRTGMLLDRNPDFYEMDMDLRAEKEKQRSVMLKLREISGVDPEFSNMCIAYLEKVGFNIPALNRLTTPGMTGRKNRNAGVGEISGVSAWGGGAASMFREGPNMDSMPTNNDNGRGRDGVGVTNTMMVEVQHPNSEMSQQKQEVS